MYFLKMITEKLKYLYPINEFYLNELSRSVYIGNKLLIFHLKTALISAQVTKIAAYETKVTGRQRCGGYLCII